MYGETQFLPIVSRLVHLPESPFYYRFGSVHFIRFSALLDVPAFYGLAFTHQIGADRELSGFERGFRIFEECFFDSVRWWAT